MRRKGRRLRIKTSLEMDSTTNWDAAMTECGRRTPSPLKRLVKYEDPHVFEGETIHWVHKQGSRNHVGNFSVIDQLTWKQIGALLEDQHKDATTATIYRQVYTFFHLYKERRNVTPVISSH